MINCFWLSLSHTRGATDGTVHMQLDSWRCAQFSEVTFVAIGVVVVFIAIALVGPTDLVLLLSAKSEAVGVFFTSVLCDTSVNFCFENLTWVWKPLLLVMRHPSTFSTSTL